MSPRKFFSSLIFTACLLLPITFISYIKLQRSLAILREIKQIRENFCFFFQYIGQFVLKLLYCHQFSGDEFSYAVSCSSSKLRHSSSKQFSFSTFVVLFYKNIFEGMHAFPMHLIEDKQTSSIYISDF